MKNWAAALSGSSSAPWRGCRAGSAGRCPPRSGSGPVGFSVMSGVKPPALDHEAGDHPVEDGAVVVAGPDVGEEVLGGLGGLVGVELDDDPALGRLQRHPRVPGRCRAHALLGGGVAGCGLFFGGAAGTRSASKQTRGAMLTFILKNSPLAMNNATDGSTGSCSGDPVGLVLAGGASSRMGRDKALLRGPGGHPAGAGGAAARAVCAEVAVADGGRGLLPGAPSLPDGPGRGPAAGILGAAAAYPGRRLLVLACDLPRVPAALLAELARPRRSTGRCRAGAAASSRSAPSTGRRRSPRSPGGSRAGGSPSTPCSRRGPPRFVLEGEELARFGEPGEIFLNLNTPEDWERYVSDRPGRAAAGPAGADLAQKIIAVDAGAVAVREGDRDGVVAHRPDRLGGDRLGRRVVDDLEAGVPLAAGAGAPAAQVLVCYSAAWPSLQVSRSRPSSGSRRASVRMGSMPRSYATRGKTRFLPACLAS